jgi:hypothetical protein
MRRWRKRSTLALSALCQKQTSRGAANTSLFDHVVGAPPFTDDFAFLTFQKNGGACQRLSGFCHNPRHSITDLVTSCLLLT